MAVHERYCNYEISEPKSGFFRLTAAAADAASLNRVHPSVGFLYVCGSHTSLVLRRFALVLM